MEATYITNGVTQDGFGARLQRCISVICFVEYLRNELGLSVEYLHTPFSYQGDGPAAQDYNAGESIRGDFSLANSYPYDDISREGYFKRAKKWDEALAFKKRTIEHVYLKDFTHQEGYQEFNACRERNALNNMFFVIRLLHGEYDCGTLDINNFVKYRSNILDYFGFKKSQSKKPTIALHIRRKDSLDKGNRHTEDSYYLDILKELEPYKSEYDITIYTQRVGFNSDLYQGWNIAYDDTEEDYETFIKLVSADHLIVGSSSFSYVAALLNQNTIVYHYKPGSHKAVSSWINADQYKELLNNKKQHE